MHILGIEKNWFEWVFNLFKSTALAYKISGQCLYVYEKCKVFTCNYTCNLHVIIGSVIFIRTKFPKNQFLIWDFFTGRQL